MAAKPSGSDKFTLDGTGDAPDGLGGTPISDGGDNGGNTGTIDPASLSPAGDALSGAVKRGRGRPKGSGSRASGKATASPLDIGSVETILFNLHAMVAAATGFDKLALNNEEANSLAKAVNNVQQFYPTHISAKSLAWTNLFMVAGTVYGSRAVAIWADQKAEATQPAKGPDGSTVLDMTGRRFT